MENSGKTPKQLVEELYDMFSTFKTRMEDPNYIQLESTLNQLVENQIEMKGEIRELKKQLLNPFNGVIVETKKNTDYIESLKEREEEFSKILDEHKAIVRWKGAVNKVGVGIFGAIGTILTFLYDKFFH